MKPKKRESVWLKYDGKCAYCGVGLSDKWQVDHLLPLARDPFTGSYKCPERNLIDNLMPSCISCNNYKSSHSLEEFRRLISELKKQLNLRSQYRIAKRYGFVIEKDIEVVFHFEKFDK
jgi:5-methylcytosine-specific restriction endonuclease McrA